MSAETSRHVLQPLVVFAFLWMAISFSSMVPVGTVVSPSGKPVSVSSLFQWGQEGEPRNTLTGSDWRPLGHLPD